MPPFYPYTPSAIAPTPTCSSTHSLPSFTLLTLIATPAAISTPMAYTTLATSSTIEDIIHQISAADIPAQPMSTLDFTIKTASSGSDRGGLSTAATIGIIAGVIILLFVLGIFVVKRWRY